MENPATWGKVKKAIHMAYSVYPEVIGYSLESRIYYTLKKLGYLSETAIYEEEGNHNGTGESNQKWEGTPEGVSG